MDLEFDSDKTVLQYASEYAAKCYPNNVNKQIDCVEHFLAGAKVMAMMYNVALSELDE